MCVFYCAGQSSALQYAVSELKQTGCTFSDRPEAATHLLLPVPSSLEAGELTDILQRLPEYATVIGGKLPDISSHAVIDLLCDPLYTAENAYITACCAVSLLMQRMPVLRDEAVLVIGWGRIGKCLAQLLRSMGARVSVAARREGDRATLVSLGYEAIPVEKLSGEGYCAIFNTVPASVLSCLPSGCIGIDLASTPGIGGSRVLWARALPGKLAPERTGRLIAKTVLRLCGEACV